MKNQTKKENNSSWIVGGTTMIGIGVGFIFLQTNVFLFLASILVGIGLGLVLAPIISCKNNDE